MSRLGEVARVKRTLKLFDMILNKHIDSINPENTYLIMILTIQVN
jgi:hypothetical protein